VKLLPAPLARLATTEYSVGSDLGADRQNGCPEPKTSPQKPVASEMRLYRRAQQITEPRRTSHPYLGGTAGHPIGLFAGKRISVSLGLVSESREEKSSEQKWGELSLKLRF
jgi:hypothetical protein